MFEILNESVAQKEKFRIAANKLLNHCFLLKKREDTKKDYFFVKQNLELFVTYFDLLGYDVKMNEDQGVIGLVNQFSVGRVELSKYESIVLLILRLLYIEKRKELATYSEEVTVLMEEIREKYAMLKIRAKPVMDKGMERNFVKLFRKYNLIQNLDTDVNQADARIVIYPSIIMAVTVENVNQYYEMTEQKLKEYAVGNDGADKDNE
ncbi:MAG: DUF4194 domain-containing protein [Lachnospiraceae bacterium]|nr:DUF4194 domain-containing protein [Lachnospiraceae bacterium]MDD7176663.1 DUF4194 domain-containing protein [bacterium]MDY5516333.1 DUF4194 domain-containing protein [Lachnospiraceae bacterium]